MRSRTSLFFFVIIYNYLFLRAVLFPYFYSYLENNIIGFIFLFFCIILAFIFYFVKVDIDLIKQSWVRIPLSFVLIFRSLCGIALCIILLKRIFFLDVNIYLLSFGLVLSVLGLSLFKYDEIVELSAPFGIIIGLSYIFYIIGSRNFLNNEISIDLTNNYLVYLLGLSFIIDNYLLAFIVKDKKDKPFMFLGYLVSLFLFFYEYLVLISSSGTILFKNEFFNGFHALAISGISRFNFSFLYVYIVMVIITASIKYSYFLSITKKILNVNNKILTILISLLIYLSLFFLFRIYETNFIYLYYFLIGSFIILISYVIWVIKNARRV